jgi:hypothetical protein
MTSGSSIMSSSIAAVSGYREAAPVDRLVEATGPLVGASPTIDEVVALVSGVGDPSPTTASEAAAPTTVVVSGIGAPLPRATSSSESLGS